MRSTARARKGFRRAAARGAAARRRGARADGRAARPAARAERVATRGRPTASPCTRSSSGCARSARTCSTRPDERDASTGRPRRSWPSRRFWPTAPASASPAKTSSAAPSAIATPCCTTSRTGAIHVPLQSLPQARAAFEIHNSPLSENAVLGFEYGYSVQAPSRLVIWEAQYGDFINGAQVIIDEFLASARSKWGQEPSLVLLLPHAHEGQGPDHASARPERFLQLAADVNMRIANCTTAAQYFHLLRRQAALLLTDPLPLVVLTPKSLLRHPLVASTPRELAEGRFRTVHRRRRGAGPGGRDPPRARLHRQGLRRSRRQRQARRRRATSRSSALEQLYPVPAQNLRADARRLHGARTRSSGCRKSPRTWARGTSSGRICVEAAAGPSGARDRAPAQRESRRKDPRRATRVSSRS